MDKKSREVHDSPNILRISQVLPERAVSMSFLARSPSRKVRKPFSMSMRNLAMNSQKSSENLVNEKVVENMAASTVKDADNVDSEKNDNIPIPAPRKYSLNINKKTEGESLGSTDGNSDQSSATEKQTCGTTQYSSDKTEREVDSNTMDCQFSAKQVATQRKSISATSLDEKSFVATASDLHSAPLPWLKLRSIQKTKF